MKEKSYQRSNYKKIFLITLNLYFQILNLSKIFLHLNKLKIEEFYFINMKYLQMIMPKA